MDWFSRQSQTGCICLTFLQGVFSSFFQWVLKMSVCWVAYSHWLHFLDFSPLCVFRCVLKLPAWDYVFSYMCPLSTWIRSCIVTLVAFVWLFSTVRFQMFTQRAWISAGKVTQAAFFSYSPPCIFKSLVKSPAWKKAYSHRLHLFGILHCVFSNVCSKCLNKMIQSCIVCICWTFSSVCVQMSPQIACLREGIFTLVAFIPFLVTVCCQMFVQNACTRGNKVALAAFVWLFPSVRFQMGSQNACMWGCISQKAAPRLLRAREVRATISRKLCSSILYLFITSLLQFDVAHGHWAGFALCGPPPCSPR